MYLNGHANTFMRAFCESLSVAFEEPDKGSLGIFRLPKEKDKKSTLQDFVFGTRRESNFRYDVGYAYVTLRWLCRIPLNDGDEASLRTVAETRFSVGGNQEICLAEQLICATSLFGDDDDGVRENNLNVLCPSWRSISFFLSKTRLVSTPSELPAGVPEQRYRTVYFCIAVLCIACEFANVDVEHEDYDEDVVERMSFVKPLLAFARQAIEREFNAEPKLTLMFPLNEKKRELVERRCRAFFGDDVFRLP